MPRASIKWAFCLSHIRPCCYISHHRAEALSGPDHREMHVYCPLFLLCLGRDMWNYLDVIVEIIYVFIVILRITTIARGGIPYNNRLLEISNYLYGINTLLMVLRVSSILELSPTIGPLQLALYRMCGDLLIIVSQYCFVILGFSMAITKSYKAELSYLTPPSYSGESVGKSME